MLWIGQVLSDLGSEIGQLAYPLLVLALTRSPVLAGVVTTAASAVAFLVRLPAGSLADRFDRRRTMIVCDAVRAVALAGLAGLLVVGAVAWPVVLAVAILDRVGDTLFTPASSAALTVIVPSEQLELAWATTEGRQYAANLAGPALGGFLYGISRAVPFAADAISYGISALTSSRIDGDFAPAGDADSRRGLWAEAFDGVRFLWRDSVLRAVLIEAPLINFAFSGAIYTIVVGLRHAGSSATVVGSAQAAIMAGGLLGAFLAPRIQPRVSLLQLILIFPIIGTLLLGVAGVILPSPAAAAPLAIPLILAPATNAAIFAKVMRQTPTSMQGRTNAALTQVAMALAALAPLVSGILIANASAGWAMAAFALALAAVLPIALLTLGLRDGQEPRP